jgi:hypothetical protein
MTANTFHGIILVITAVLAITFVTPERNETLAAPPHPQKPAEKDAGGTSAISLTNIEDGETLRYPVALLLGTLRDRNETTVAIINRSAQKEIGRQWRGIAFLGRFKALVELQPGKNHLQISTGKAKLSFALHYRPQTNPYFVRMVYITDKSGNTDFQTPVPNDPHDFRGKFDAALKLMQCFTAEDMNAHGYGRRTFNLEFDEHGRVVTHVVKAERSAEEYWKETDDGRWYTAAGEAIEKQMPNPMAKNLAVLAFSSFDPATKRNRAHLALGGGNLACFGGSSIYTWPNSIADVQRACMDARMTDVERFATDSVGRNSYWANTSTQAGACLHELGHTFGLPHSADYNGIMVRGIDNFTRKFVFIDPPCAGRAEPLEFKDDEIGHWEPVSLAAMAPARHFALDARPWSERSTIRPDIDMKSGAVTVESEDGLRFVGVDGPGRADFFMPIDFNRPPPHKVSVPLSMVGRRVASREACLRIVDAQGHDVCMPILDLAKDRKDIDLGALATLLSGPFVRTWQFSKITLPWSGPPAFAAVNDAKLKVIVDSALHSTPVTAPENFVDFAPQFPSERRDNLAGYVVRKLLCDRPRKVRLSTGSDDALRIWLNGRVVQEVAANRDAQADSENCTVDLPKGESILVAEVSQGNGAWGLILRLQDAEGHDLALADDGKVVECPNQDCSGRPIGQSNPGKM